MLNDTVGLVEEVLGYQKEENVKKNYGMVRNIYMLGFMFLTVVFLAPLLGIKARWFMGIITVISALIIWVAYKYVKNSNGRLNSTQKKYINKIQLYLVQNNLYEEKVLDILVNDVKREIDLRIKKRNAGFTVIAVLKCPIIVRQTNLTIMGFFYD